MKRITLVLLVLLIAPVMAVAPTSNFYLVPTDMKVYSMVPYDAMVYQDGTYTIAVNRTGGIISSVLTSSHTDDVPIEVAVLVANGGHLYISKGTYQTDAPGTFINLGTISDTIISGAGPGTIIKSTYSGGSPWFNMLIGGDGCNRVTIQDLTLDGGYPTVQYKGVLGEQWLVRIQGDGNRFKHVIFKNSPDCGIVTGVTSNLVIEDCVFVDIGEHPFYFSSTTNGVKIINCDFFGYGRTARGFFVRGDGVQNLTIEECTINPDNGTWNDVTKYGVVLSGGERNILVKDCNFIGMARPEGISSTHANVIVIGVGVNTYNVQIVGGSVIGFGTFNFGDSVESLGTGFVKDVYFDTTLSNGAGFVPENTPTLIENCYFKNLDYYIRMSENTTFSKCTFYGMQYFNLADGCKILDSTFKNTVYDGSLLPSAGNNTQFIGNDVDKGFISGLTYRGTSGNTDNMVIERNRFRDGGTYHKVLEFNASHFTNLTIRDNTLDVGITLPIIPKTSTNIVDGNVGYKNRNRGSTPSISDGGTIAHGLATTPTWCGKPSGTIPDETITVTAKGATTITVAIKKNDGSTGTTQTVDWECEV